MRNVRAAATTTSTPPLAPRTGPAQTASRERPRPTPRGGLSRGRRHLSAWLFLAPALVIFAGFKFVPMARAIEMSVYEVRPYLGDQWVGLAKYREVLTDAAFVTAIWQTGLLAVGQTGGALAVGLVLALVLEGSARHLWLLRTAVFLPTVAAMAVVAEVWRILYYPSADGVLNSILGWTGLGPSPFLNSEDSALASVLLVGVWRGAPYDMMIFIAGLAGVDRTLYEAAAIDGAGAWRRLWHITVPAMRPVFAILLTLAAIRGLRVFTEVFLLTNGGPNGSTEVIMTLIYKVGLERNELGVASAGSVLLLVATVWLTGTVLVLRGREHRADRP